MMEFTEVLNRYNWEKVQNDIYSKQEPDVIKALHTSKPQLEDFMALISPAAEPYIEQIAQKSHHLTKKRFGKTVQMYLPLYLSNECTNYCIYCGFNRSNRIERKTLSFNEIVKEAEAIKGLGYEHILLVTGENPSTVNLEYFKQAVELLKQYFSLISW